MVRFESFWKIPRIDHLTEGVDNGTSDESRVPFLQRSQHDWIRFQDLVWSVDTVDTYDPHDEKLSKY